MKKEKNPNIAVRDDRGKMEAKGLEKATAHTLHDLIKYKDSSVVTKPILKKATGTVSAMSFDAGEGTNENTSAFDTFVQIIEGTANIMIDGELHILKDGEGIIIPAHTPSYIRSNGRFKMLMTVIKSGYEL